jgi:hypothetical protein
VPRGVVSLRVSDREGLESYLGHVVGRIIPLRMMRHQISSTKHDLLPEKYAHSKLPHGSHRVGSRNPIHEAVNEG